MSDEFISDRKTFCVILDRKEFFEKSNYWFCKIGHVTPENLEMSGIALRIEWKHSRNPAGPPSGRNRPLKGRNVGFGHAGTFFRSYEKFEKWEEPNFWVAGENELFLGGWNRSEVLRAPGGCASLHKGPGPTRIPRMLRIIAASYPIFDLASSGP